MADEFEVKYLKTLDEYNTQIAKDDKVTFIDFTATWCGPCQTIGPKYFALAKGLKEQAHFFKLDVDANDQASQAAGISCMPTFMAFKGNTKIGSMSGADEAKLKAFVNGKIANPVADA